MNSELNIALHALVFLDHKGTTLSSEEIAENVCTNPARIRKVMAALKRAGLVSTKEGAEGGYRFEGDPRMISLRRVSEAIGVRFVSSSWKSGDVDMECLIASGMGELMETLYRDLDLLCREHLAEISVADIERRIFGEGADDEKTG